METPFLHIHTDLEAYLSMNSTTSSQHFCFSSVCFFGKNDPMALLTRKPSDPPEFV